MMADGLHQMVTYDGEAGKVQAYLAKPEGEGPRPAVIVIHEIYGLNDQIKDVANRFAAQGYVAFAPHLYSRPGLVEVLTPANIEQAMQFQMSLARDRMSDMAYVREEMAKLPAEKRETLQKVFPVYSHLPGEQLTQDLVKAVDFLNDQSFVQVGKIASVGFCFGGGMSINLACHARLAACVVFYGSNPEPIEQVKNIVCPVLGLYGADDMRINQNLDKLVKAMVDTKKDFEMKIYPGAAHAFFNNTRKEVYREGPAKDSWERVLRFYKTCLSS
jgi:carboxymethylenebutenolidase